MWEEKFETLVELSATNFVLAVEVSCFWEKEIVICELF